MNAHVAIKTKDVSPYEHVIDTRQFSPEYLDRLFAKADEILDNNKRGYDHVLRGMVIGIVFYEASTRTRFSFESAVARLGGHRVTTENAEQFSSSVKGESLTDTVRILSGNCDMLVMRHKDDDACERAYPFSVSGHNRCRVPMINAGNGKEQHPTQALLDAYTIKMYHGRLHNLRVAIVGDLLHGRTCGSLAYILSKFPGNEILFVSPEEFRIKQGIKDHLKEHDVDFGEYTCLAPVVKNIDVLYMTRVQKERFASEGGVKEKEWYAAQDRINLTQKIVDSMKPKSLIMHPLPRNSELPKCIDNDSRAKYFEQADNGLPIRMALLSFLAEGIR